MIQVSKKFRPPKSAINNAKKGLEFRKKYGRGGLTPAEAKSYGIDSGITRAKRIASGKLSAHDVRRMSAFNRHRGNYNPSKKMTDGGPTAGTIAWLLWGGTSGVNWAKKQSAALGAEESFTDDEKDRVRERLIRLSKPASDSFIEGYLTAKKDLEQRKTSSKKQAESFEAHQGILKFKNAEILQILMNQNWKCSHCNNIIKNKQNIPFSEQEQNNVTWAIFEDLTNYDDINVRRKAPRNKKGSNVRKKDGTLNFDNLLLLCYDCAENRLAERKVSISFRTSQENVNWLKELANNNGINITELCNQIIQEYRNNYEAESFEAEIFESQGTLKFSNREIIQLLFNKNWKCRNCDNIIKNKQNIPFSEEEQKDITWAMLAKEYDLTNYDDINVVRKKPRGSKDNLARIDGELNFDNLLLLCHSCYENRRGERKEPIAFRISKEKKEWLGHLAKDKDKSMTELMGDIIDEYINNYEAESFEANDDVFTHSVVLGFKFRHYTKQNPIYKKKQDGSFNLDPIHIVKLKILILREMDLEGVEYDDATITADSLLFKFNFTNEIEAQKFNAYVREYLSQNEKVEELQQYFIKADARVMTKYEAGIIFSTLMDWSNREYLIDFLEYLIKLEEYDYEYSLQFLRERGVDIEEQDDAGVSLKDLMLAEKEGYQSMLEELINDIKNKGRRLDDVAFTLSADNGLKNQTMASMFAIQQAIEKGIVNRTMSLQYLRYEGKLEAINQFLFYVYGDEDSFIFDNI